MLAIHDVARVSDRCPRFASPAAKPAKELVGSIVAAPPAPSSKDHRLPVVTPDSVSADSVTPPIPESLVVHCYMIVKCVDTFMAH